MLHRLPKKAFATRSDKDTRNSLIDDLRRTPAVLP